jgi:hypothetical protein
MTRPITLLGTVTLALVLAPAPSARAEPLPGNGPAERAPAERVFVPVPVDDTTNELLQMQIAAAVGAVAAGAYVQRRYRRRAGPPPAGGNDRPGTSAPVVLPGAISGPGAA